jgi:glycosyltransferase involved in cell wall biosynthesis
MSSPGSDKKLSIAMLITSFQPRPEGGAEIQCKRLAKEMIRKGINVTIITEGEKGLKKFEYIDGIPVYRMYSFLNRFVLKLYSFIKIFKKFKSAENALPIENDLLPYNPQNYNMQSSNIYFEGISYLLFFFNCYFFLLKKRKNFALLHVHIVPWISFVGALLGKLIGKKVLVKESTTSGLEKFTDLPGGRFMQKFVVKNCYFIALTRYIEEKLLSHGIPEKRIFRIPNGVYLKERGEIDKKEKFVYLFVGNLSQGAAKGLDVLLKAWKTVTGNCENVELWILGNGDSSKFDRFIDNLGINKFVKFWGSVANLDWYYQNADIYVISSRREGMSNSLLEAMSFGLPVVGTRISGNEDLIENGTNGFLVDVDNVDQLAESLILMYKNKQQAHLMGNKSREIIIKKCTFDIIIDKYFNIYKKLVYDYE